jgi:crotonobetainyl-CoA:carnitine CoA-transferase CaiB-like acyl-CoA transferase
MTATPETPGSETYPPILGGLRVLDLSHQYSGALAASLLADLGATVLAVEHPSKKAIRTMLPRKGEESMWWKVVGRGKHLITLDIGSERGREMVLELARDAEVIIENFRPGTLEKWQLGPEDLAAAGVNAVMLRISGFGQTGPARGKPGFGTVAEAMSGFAYLNGESDGSPTFPSTTLADGVAAVFGAFGLLAALVGRHRGQPGPSVEVVDMALFEGLFRIIPTQIAGYDQLGLVPVRPGNRLTSHGVLRNLYTTKDGRYFVVAGVGPVPVKRIMRAVGAGDLAARVDAGVMNGDPKDVEEYLNTCDAVVVEWAAKHDFDEVKEAMGLADAVFQTVYNVADIVTDEQYAAREDLIRVPDDALGEILMQGIVPKFPSRDHRVRWAGAARGADNASVYGERLGLTKDELDRLARDRII